LDGTCKWQYVSGTPTGNAELHATSTANSIICAGVAAAQKGLYVTNGVLTPGLCDSSGAASGGVDIGSVTYPFSAIYAGSLTLSGNASVGGTLGVTGSTTLAAVSETSRTLVSLAESKTLPTISSGFCTGAVIQNANGTSAFQVAVGTSCSGISTGVVGMPASSHGWSCNYHNTTHASVNKPDMTGSTTTTNLVTNYARSNGAVTNFTDSDLLAVDCHGF
jgi:hypothetical protein